MNGFSLTAFRSSKFLNGVCRHELIHVGCELRCDFLNGVCRHEHERVLQAAVASFLNGVCRHELK